MKKLISKKLICLWVFILICGCFLVNKTIYTAQPALATKYRVYFQSDNTAQDFFSAVTLSAWDGSVEIPISNPKAGVAVSRDETLNLRIRLNTGYSAVNFDNTGNYRALNVNNVTGSAIISGINAVSNVTVENESTASDIFFSISSDLIKSDCIISIGGIDAVSTWPDAPNYIFMEKPAGTILENTNLPVLGDSVDMTGQTNFTFELSPPASGKRYIVTAVKTVGNHTKTNLVPDTAGLYTCTTGKGTILKIEAVDVNAPSMTFQVVQPNPPAASLPSDVIKIYQYHEELDAAGNITSVETNDFDVFGAEILYDPSLAGNNFIFSIQGEYSESNPIFKVGSPTAAGGFYSANGKVNIVVSGAGDVIYIDDFNVNTYSVNISYDDGTSPGDFTSIEQSKLSSVLFFESDGTTPLDINAISVKYGQNYEFIMQENTAGYTINSAAVTATSANGNWDSSTNFSYSLMGSSPQKVKIILNNVTDMVNLTISDITFETKTLNFTIGAGNEIADGGTFADHSIVQGIYPCVATYQDVLDPITHQPTGQKTKTWSVLDQQNHKDSLPLQLTYYDPITFIVVLDYKYYKSGTNLNLTSISGTEVIELKDSNDITETVTYTPNYPSNYNIKNLSFKIFTIANIDADTNCEISGITLNMYDMHFKTTTQLSTSYLCFVNSSTGAIDTRFSTSNEGIVKKTAYVKHGSDAVFNLGLYTSATPASRPSDVILEIGNDNDGWLRDNINDTINNANISITDVATNAQGQRSEVKVTLNNIVQDYTDDNQMPILVNCARNTAFEIALKAISGLGGNTFTCYIEYATADNLGVWVQAPGTFDGTSNKIFSSIPENAAIRVRVLTASSYALSDTIAILHYTDSKQRDDFFDNPTMSDTVSSIKTNDSIVFTLTNKIEDNIAAVFEIAEVSCDISVEAVYNTPASNDVVVFTEGTGVSPLTPTGSLDATNLLAIYPPIANFTNKTKAESNPLKKKYGSYLNFTITFLKYNPGTNTYSTNGALKFTEDDFKNCISFYDYGSSTYNSSDLLTGNLIPALSSPTNIATDGTSASYTITSINGNFKMQFYALKAGTVSLETAAGVQYLECGANGALTSPEKELSGSYTTTPEGKYYFAIKAREGYDLNTLVVYNDGAVITPEIQNADYWVYHLTGVKTVAHISAKINKLTKTVTLKDDSAGNFTAGNAKYFLVNSNTPISMSTSGYPTTVSYGEDFLFKVALDTAYSKSQIKIYATDLVTSSKKELFVASDGYYHIYGVKNPQEVSVEGVTLNKYNILLAPMTGMEYLDMSNNVISGVPNVNDNDYYEFKVHVLTGYSMTGLVVNFKNADGTSMTLEPIASDAAANTYTYRILNIKSDKNVSIQSIAKLQYTLTFLSKAGVTYRNDLGTVLTGNQTMNHGDDFEFVFDIAPEYDESLPRVQTLNPQNADVGAAKLATGRYIIRNITSDLKISVEDVRLNTYTIIFSDIEGLVYQTSDFIDYAPGSQPVANHGTDFKFRIKVMQAYDDSDPVVMLGTEVLKPDSNGIYTIANVQENKTITVAGITTNAETDLMGEINKLPDHVKNLEDVHDVTQATILYNSLPANKRDRVVNLAKLQQLQQECSPFNHNTDGLSVAGQPWYIKLVVADVSTDTASLDRIYKNLTSEFVLSLYNISLMDTLSGKLYQLPPDSKVALTMPKPNMTYFERLTGVYANDTTQKLDYLSTTINSSKTTLDVANTGLIGLIASRSNTPGRSSLLDATGVNLDWVYNFADQFNSDQNIETPVTNPSNPDNNGGGTTVPESETDSFYNFSGNINWTTSALKLLLVLIILVLIAIIIWWIIKKRKERKQK